MGRSMDFKAAQPEKALLLIAFTVDGICIFSNDIHWTNVPTSMTVTERGIENVCNDSHFQNADLPIDSNVEGR